MIPRSAEVTLTLLIPDAMLRDAVIGDLTETYASVLATDGADAARQRLWREILVSAPHFARAAIAPATLCACCALVGGAVCRTRTFFREAST